jgi:hypothetical protein
MVADRSTELQCGHLPDYERLGSRQVGVHGLAGYTGTGYAYYETMTFMEGYQTHRGAHAQANLPLSQIGHCWVLMSAPTWRIAPTLFQQDYPPTATGTNYDMIIHHSMASR